VSFLDSISFVALLLIALRSERQGIAINMGGVFQPLLYQICRYAACADYPSLVAREKCCYGRGVMRRAFSQNATVVPTGVPACVRLRVMNLSGTEWRDLDYGICL